MSLHNLSLFNRWFIRELLNLLLRPMFVRYRSAERDGDTVRAERFELRFLRLFSACNCFPFCVEVDRCGLWILDEPSEQDDFWWEDAS